MSHVAITTEPGTEVSQQVNAVVEIICSTDSNPLSYLSLWLVTNNSPVLIASSPDAMATFTTSVTLTENYNEKDLFCQASGANGAIEVDSDTLHFEVYCKYFSGPVMNLHKQNLFGWEKETFKRQIGY